MHGVRLGELEAAEPAFAPGATAIAFSPSASTTISATPVGASTRCRSSSTPAATSDAERLVRERVAADRSHEPHLGPEPRRGERLIRALAAWNARERRAGDRLTRPRQPLAARDEVEVDRADDGDPRRVTAGACQWTQRGERADVVDRRAEQRVAQVEEPGPQRRAVGRQIEARCVGKPLERAYEHGQLEIDRRDAVGAHADAGTVEHRAPLDELARARAAVPGSSLGALGLELEQVARERLLEPGERRLDAVGGVAKRGLRAPRPWPASASPRLQRSSSRQNASAAASQARSCDVSRRAVSSSAAYSRRTLGPALAIRPRSPRGGSSAAGAFCRRPVARSRREGAPAGA